MRAIFCIAFAIIGLMMSDTANADLVGDMVDAQMTGSLTGGGLLEVTPGTATVTDPGVEFEITWFGTPYWDVDISGNSVVLNYTGLAEFQLGSWQTTALILSDLDTGTVGGILGVSMASSGISNFTPTVNFDSTSLEIFLATGPGGDIHWNPGSSLTVDLITSVPEPTSIGLVGALAGCFLLRRRRKVSA